MLFNTFRIIRRLSDDVCLQYYWYDMGLDNYHARIIQLCLVDAPVGCFPNERRLFQENIDRIDDDDLLNIDEILIRSQVGLGDLDPSYNVIDYLYVRIRDVRYKKQFERPTHCWKQEGF